ncbi:MAG TPA: hypothetical protein VEQ60_31125 [Longimicrobium sp.]|nr:hypothetical protein [Longimicrobium sp.]
MVDSNEPGSAAAAEAAPDTGHIRVPGKIVAGGAPDVAVHEAEEQDAGVPGLGELISRERLRHAETRAQAGPLTDASGARVCCVLCLNRNAEQSVEDAG